MTDPAIHSSDDGDEAAVTPRPIEVDHLGRIAYSEAEEMQDEVRDGLLAGRRGEALLLLEHDPVITLGRSATRDDVLATDAWLAERGVEVVECDRGGQVTYHGPGQLVGYPVLDLKPDRRDIRRYVRDLQQVIVRTLSDFGIAADAPTEAEAIGVWVGPRKIASIGVHLRRWVTTHGFALNVTTDLGHFDAIVPCGLTGVRMTSIEHVLGESPAVAEVAEATAAHFMEIFDRTPSVGTSDARERGRTG